MAKDGRRKCPDCDSIELGNLFSFTSKGDGNCSNCHGTGRKTDIVRALAGPILGFETDEPCTSCHGTGQCQTCGGTGFEYYYEDDQDYKSSGSKNESFYDSYDSSDYSSSYSSSSSRSNGDSYFIQIIGVIIVGVVILGLLNALGIINTNSNSNTQQNTVRVENQNNTDPLPNKQVDVDDCQTNGTGECLFKNNTDRLVYLFVYSYSWSEKYKISPQKKVYCKKIPPGNYDYKCSYYDVGNFGKNDLYGKLNISKCSSESVELVLPQCDWYNVTSDKWLEVHIPSDGSYAVVFPYKYILFRYTENGTEHSGVSYFFLPAGTDVIYLKSNGGEFEVSIQKYDQ